MNKLQPTIRYGLYSFIGIAIFFLLMRIVGLENVIALRALNILIVIYFTNQLARINAQVNSKDQYLKSLISLLTANAITVVASVVSFAIYVTFLDPHFLQNVVGGILFAQNITLDQAAVSILMEGMAGSIIVSFTLMQYWKETVPKTKVEPNKIR